MKSPSSLKATMSGIFRRSSSWERPSMAALSTMFWRPVNSGWNPEPSSRIEAILPLTRKAPGVGPAKRTHPRDRPALRSRLDAPRRNGVVGTGQHQGVRASRAGAVEVQRVEADAVAALRRHTDRHVGLGSRRIEWVVDSARDRR